MVTAIITAKGQIVIPSRIRKKMRLKKGTRLSITESGDKIIMQPLTADFFEKTAGILSGKAKLSKKLLDERRKDKEKE